MANDVFKLTTADAMGIAGQQAGTNSESMHQRLQQLIADMENDHRAVSGTTLPAFKNARARLEAAFQGLMNWCSQNGIDLTQAQTDAINTDDQMAGVFTAAQTDIVINR